MVLHNICDNKVEESEYFKQRKCSTMYVNRHVMKLFYTNMLLILKVMSHHLVNLQVTMLKIRRLLCNSYQNGDEE
jgi:hypothetical protein